MLTSSSGKESEIRNDDDISEHARTFIECLKESKSSDYGVVTHGVQFNLSQVEPTEANTHALIHAFRQMRGAFDRSSIRITTHGLNQDQLQMLAIFINRLPLPKNTEIHLVKGKDELSLPDLRFFLATLSNKHINRFSLRDIPLATTLSHNKFVQMVNMIVSTEGPFNEIDFEWSTIRTVPTQVILQQFQRLEDRGVERILLHNSTDTIEKVLSLGPDFLWELRNKYSNMSVNVFPDIIYDTESKAHFEQYASELEPSQLLKLSEVYFDCAIDANLVDVQDRFPRLTIPKTQRYELAERLLILAIKTDKIYQLEKLLKFSLQLNPDEVFRLTKKSFEYDNDELNLRKKDLSYSQRLELLMLGAQKFPAYFFRGDKLHLDSHDAPQGVRDIFSAIRATISNNDNEASMSASDDESAEMEDMYQQVSTILFPKLRQSCRDNLPQFSFLLDMLSTIEKAHQKGEEYFFPTLNMSGWFSYICVKLMQIYPSGNRSPSKRELDLLGKVFKEILGFTSPLMRYKIAAQFLDLHQDDEFILTFNELTRKRGNVAILPAVILSCIVCENNETQAESRQAAMGILDSISLSQYDGHYFRTLICALLAISQEAKLTPAVKLSVLKQVFAQLPEHLAEQAKIEAVTKSFIQRFFKTCAQRNPSADHLVVASGSVLSLADKQRLKNERTTRQAFCKKFITDFADDCKSVVMKELMTKFSSKRLEGFIPNTGSSNDVEKKQVALGRFIRLDLENGVFQQFKDREFKLQISHLITVQGLANLGVLGAVKEFSAHALMDFMKQLFNLTPAQAALYPEVFGKCRNQGALLTYYSKIQTLEISKKGKELVAFFKGFVQNILSPGSSNYYEKRYQKEPGSHYEAVFLGKPELEKTWRQGRSENFTQFYKRKNIKVHDFEPDFPEFLQSRIFKHEHINIKYYGLLKDYLNADATSTRDEICGKASRYIDEIKCKTEENPTDHTLKQQWYHAQVQSKLIELLRLPIDATKRIKERYQAHQKLLGRVATLLNQLSHDQFRRDIASIITALRHNDSKQTADHERWRNWRIVITDNYWDLFMAGTDVEGSCQDVTAHVSLNKCLMAFPGDPKIQMAAIQDDTGTTVARAIIRILPNLEEKVNALYFEELYPSMLRPDFAEALRQYTIEFADHMRVPLISGEAAGPDSKPFEGTLTSISSPVPWEYVDALFGVMEGEYEITGGFVLFEPKLKLDERLKSISSEFVSTEEVSSVFSDGPPSPVMVPGLLAAQAKNMGNLHGKSKAVVDNESPTHKTDMH